MKIYKPLFFIPNKNFYSRIVEIFNMMKAEYLIEITNNLEYASKNKYFFIPYQLHMEHPNLITDNSYLKSLHTIKNSYLILDYSEESIPVGGKIEKKFLELHSLLMQYNFALERIIVVTANENVDKYYANFQIKYGISYKLNVLGFNPLLFRNTFWLLKNTWFCDLLKKIPIFSKENKVRDKKYMCLNLRPRMHRAATVSYLLYKSYLNDGAISYFGEKFGSIDSISVDEDEKVFTFIANIFNNEKFLCSYRKLQKTSPIIFDKNEDKIRNYAYNNENLKKWNHLIPELDNIENVKICSYFEIVTETWFENDLNLFISEKTMRSMVRMQFFIIIGSPFTLKYLKTLGFKSFHPYINEEYDEIINLKERIIKIFREIDKLCELSHNELINLYRKLYPIIEHNYFTLIEKMPEIFKTHINNKLISKINLLTQNNGYKFLDKIKNLITIKNVVSS